MAIHKLLVIAVLPKHRQTKRRATVKAGIRATESPRFRQKLEIRVRNNPLPVSGFLSFPKYPRGRFENANIYIPPTFQETVESHFKPSLPVVATCIATLNQFNSNIFSGFSKQYSTCKNITIHYYTHTL